MRGAVVGASVGVADGLRQLVFDVIGPEVQHFIQHGARHRPEAMAGHFVFAVAHAPQRRQHAVIRHGARPGAGVREHIPAAPGERVQVAQDRDGLRCQRDQMRLPADKMKTGEPHLVPLAPQAVAILRDLYALTGRGRYVFPSPRTALRPMSNGGVLSALRRMGYGKDEMTGHGFRAMARTVLDEVLHFRPDYIEHQLAHAVRDPNGRAYNRTAHLAERRKMMTAWADYLDALREDTGTVLTFKRKASGEAR